MCRETCQAHLVFPISIATNTETVSTVSGIYDIYNAVSNPEALSASQIRNFEINIKNMAVSIPVDHPLNSLLSNINTRILGAKKIHLKQYTNCKQRLISTEDIAVNFESDSNGISFGLRAIQAKISSKSKARSGHLTSAVRKSLPWFTKHISTTEQLNHRLHVFNRNITITEHAEQFSFGSTMEKHALSVSKNLIKRLKKQQVVVWGSPNFCQEIAKFCEKMKIEVRVLNVKEISAIKGRVEQTLNKDELNKTAQHRSPRIIIGSNGTEKLTPHSFLEKQMKFASSKKIAASAI